VIEQALHAHDCGKIDVDRKISPIPWSSESLFKDPVFVPKYGAS
jgi:hypothetical protein